MHIISRRRLREFWEQHPDSATSLQRWYRIISRTDFAGIQDLRRVFPSADPVGRLVVFNIGGNKYRLVASVHFNRQKLYVRHILTHSEYDRGDWKK